MAPDSKDGTLGIVLKQWCNQGFENITKFFWKQPQDPKHGSQYNFLEAGLISDRARLEGMKGLRFESEDRIKPKKEEAQERAGKDLG